MNAFKQHNDSKCREEYIYNIYIYIYIYISGQYIYIYEAIVTFISQRVDRNDFIDDNKHGGEEVLRRNWLINTMEK